jgi:drug/metabolite transporter (DMT)-like permease
VALLSPLTLKEPITRPVLAGMGLALAGGLVIGLGEMCSLTEARFTCASFSEFLKEGALLGDLLALCGAWAAAGYILIGRRLRARMSLLGYIFVVYGMAAIVLITVMLAAGEPAFGYPPQAYLWFLLLAIFPQLLGHSSFNYALGYLSAAYVSISLLGEPIGSSILAYIFLDEIPSGIEIFGAILILTGIYIASRGQPGQGEQE